METKRLKFIDDLCVDIIKKNQVLAFPTETVFGLGVIYDSKEAFDNLGEIIGKTYSDEILDNLFKNFCVGK